MNIIFYMSDTHCCGHIRGEEIARQINKGRDSMIVKANVLKSDYEWADVMIFQRQLTKEVYAKMRMAKEQGIKVIYDIDDLLLEIPEELGEVAAAFNRPEVRENILRFLNDVDLITAASTGLATSLRDYCQTPICVLKNGVNPEDWVRSVTETNGVTIGWMGSKSHIADAELVSKALHRVMSETDARLKLIGWVGDTAFSWLGEFGDRIQQVGWVEVNILPAAMGDIDIGIAPLLNTKFCAAKSSVKWMQYSAMGIPTVMSPVSCYIDDVEHMKTGVFASNEEEWFGHIKELVEDESLRKAIGRDAMLEILKKHTTKRRSEELLEVCRSME